VTEEQIDRGAPSRDELLRVGALRRTEVLPEGLGWKVRAIG
jgi:hypothetical protein